MWYSTFFQILKKSALRQSLQRINPIQTRHRLGNLIPFGHKEIFKSAVISGNKFFGTDNPRVREVAGTISLKTLKGESQTIHAFYKRDSKITADIYDLEREKKLIQTRTLSYEKQLALLDKKIAYTEAGADELLGLEERLNQVKNQKAILQLAQKEIRQIELQRYLGVSETITEMELRVQRELKQKQKIVTEKKETLVSLEEIHGRIAGLIAEIRSRAGELLEADEDRKSCPVCGAKYKKGELLISQDQTWFGSVANSSGLT